MFTIFGASGNTGKVAAETLLAGGEKVRVMVRDPKKVDSLKKLGAEVLAGELASKGDVARALQGAKGAYVLLPPNMASTRYLAERREMADVLAAAIQETRVPHVVLLSSIGAQHPSGTGPIAALHHAERTLAPLTGTTFSFVRAAYFMENFLSNVQPMKADGVLPVFGGGESHPFEMVASQDIGKTAASLLLSPPKSNETIRLHAAKSYSNVDVARIAASILGRPVLAKPVAIEAMVPTLQSFGISENVASLYREMTVAGQQGLLSYEGNERAIVAPTTLDAFLTSVLSSASN